MAKQVSNFQGDFYHLKVSRTFFCTSSVLCTCVNVNVNVTFLIEWDILKDLWFNQPRIYQTFVRFWVPKKFVFVSTLDIKSNKKEVWSLWTDMKVDGVKTYDKTLSKSFVNIVAWFTYIRGEGGWRDLCFHFVTLSARHQVISSTPYMD